MPENCSKTAITIKEVAETFGVSRGTIYRSLGLGKFGTASHIPSAPTPEEPKPSSVPRGLMTGPDAQWQLGVNRRSDIRAADYIKQLEQQIAEAQEQLDQIRSRSSNLRRTQR